MQGNNSRQLNIPPLSSPPPPFMLIGIKYRWFGFFIPKMSLQQRRGSPQIPMRLLIIIAVAVIGIMAVFLITPQQPTPDNIGTPDAPKAPSQGQQTTQPTTPQQKTATKRPSELVLDTSDFVGNYTIKERTPRLKSDVDEYALGLGWKEGYFVHFIRIGETIFDSTSVEQTISVYPLGKAQEVLEWTATKYLNLSNENVTVEEMPLISIGDGSVAFRLTAHAAGATKRAYMILFYKWDIYVGLGMSGHATDYEELTLLARKAEAKIV
jgi:hypothetical protein